MSTEYQPANLQEAVALLAELQLRGLYIEPSGPNLLRVGPPDLLDEFTLTQVRAAKTALMEIFSNPRTWPCVRCERFAFRTPTVCYWCRRAGARATHA